MHFWPGRSAIAPPGRPGGLTHVYQLCRQHLAAQAHAGGGAWCENYAVSHLGNVGAILQSCCDVAARIFIHRERCKS